MLPGRRNQGDMGIANPNKVPNYSIGHNTPAVRGTDNSENIHKRSNSTYNQMLVGQFTNQFVEANNKNRN